MYSLDTTLPGHVASINALVFSPDGKYLASGADGGFIFIWEVHGSREVHKLDGKSPVTALMWSSELYAGFADGRVASAKVTPDDLTAGYIPRTSDGGVVECISTDHTARRIAICAGSEVEIWTRIRTDKLGRKVLPSPLNANGRPQTPRSTVVAVTASEHEYGDGSPKCLKPRSAQFVKSGNRLLVGYIDDGIYCWEFQTQTYLWHIRTRVGRLTLTPDERYFAVSNLYDGFDLYRLSDQSWVRAFPTDTRLNVPLPVIVVEDGARLFTGTSCGQVKLVDLHTGHEIQKLYHDDDVIQALAFYSDSTGTCFLATGPSERGTETLVRIWRSQSSIRKVDVAVETEPSGVIIASPRLTMIAAPRRPYGTATVIAIMCLTCLFIVVFHLTQFGQSYDSLQIVGSHKSNFVKRGANFVRDVVANISVSAARWMTALLNRYVAYMEEGRYLGLKGFTK